MELIHVPYIEQQVHPLPCFSSNFIVSNIWSMSLVRSTVNWCPGALIVSLFIRSKVESFILMMAAFNGACLMMVNDGDDGE